MSQVSTIMSLVAVVNPTRVIDVGIGHGKYGFLCRELLESSRGGVGRFSTADETQAMQESAVVIDGVEAFKEYLTPLHELIYNRLLVGDALEVLPGIAARSYDLALGVDILEHFDEPEARRFVAELVRVAHTAIVVTPRDPSEQGAVHGNEWETHRSVWTRELLLSTGAQLVIPTIDSWISIYGDTPAVAALVWQHCWRRRIPEFPGKRFLGALRRRVTGPKA